MVVVIKVFKFKLVFLGFKFWFVWLGVFVFYIIIWLFLFVICVIGGGIGKFIVLIVFKWVKVVKCNLMFWNFIFFVSEVEVFYKENVWCIGMVLFEIVMGWWWFSWCVKWVIEIEGIEYVEVVFVNGKGVFGMVFYNMNLEFVCRGIGFFCLSIVFYCKYNNFFVDYF